MKTGMQLSQILRNVLRFRAAAVIGGALLCAGCGQSATDTPATPISDSAPADGDAHAGHEHEGHSHDDADVEAAMAKLTPEDRALAETQKVCVVAKEPLGSMGTPIKVEHDGQVAFLCCAGCKSAFEADPDKYLAALKEGGDAAAVPAEEGVTAPATEPAAEAKSEG